MIVSSAASLDYPEVSAGAILAGTAARWPDRVALVAGERKQTFGQLYERACAFAHGLHAEGIGRGDVVALHLGNGPEFAIAPRSPRGR